MVFSLANGNGRCNIMQNKFQIYYQPEKGNLEGIKSFTVSYYDFDFEHNTYRRKMVLEKDDQKYKIKEFWGNIGVFKIINAIDFSKLPKDDVDYDKAYFYIKYGDNIYATNNKESIKDILDSLFFDSLLSTDIAKYTLD